MIDDKTNAELETAAKKLGAFVYATEQLQIAFMGADKTMPYEDRQLFTARYAALEDTLNRAEIQLQTITTEIERRAPREEPVINYVVILDRHFISGAMTGQRESNVEMGFAELDRARSHYNAMLVYDKSKRRLSVPATGDLYEVSNPRFEERENFGVAAQ